MIAIDGSLGEGGGQVLRSSLALSILTGQPFRIARIRGGRRKPGLLRQHLTCVQAAVAVCGASAEGATLGSSELVFRPGVRQAGSYRFAVGTAGSTGLVLQTILPVLVTAGGPSRIVIEGGTHNDHSPPFHFLERAFLPLLRRMGPVVSAELERWGFYPAGGGRIVVDIEPVPRLAPLRVEERGAIERIEVTAAVSRLPAHIADREIEAVRLALGPDRAHGRAVRVDSDGPGNVVFATCEAERVTEVFTGFGRRGVGAEAVGRELADEVARWLAVGAPIGEHLADQLLVPMALGSGAFVTGPLSLHATTNLDVIERFLGVRPRLSAIGATTRVGFDF